MNKKVTAVEFGWDSPVPIELDGEICHDLQGLVSQLEVHGDGAYLAGEGAGDLQPLGLHGREPDL